MPPATPAAVRKAIAARELAPLYLLLDVRGLPPDRLSQIPIPGDASWNRILEKLLERPEGTHVRPHLRRIRAGRHARMFERRASRMDWGPAWRELRAALALDPTSLVRLETVRRKLPHIGALAARSVVARTLRLLGLRRRRGS